MTPHPGHTHQAVGEVRQDLVGRCPEDAADDAAVDPGDRHRIGARSPAEVGREVRPADLGERRVLGGEEEASTRVLFPKVALSCSSAVNPQTLRRNSRTQRPTVVFGATPSRNTPGPWLNPRSATTGPFRTTAGVGARGVARVLDTVGGVDEPLGDGESSTGRSAGRQPAMTPLTATLPRR